MLRWTLDFGGEVGFLGYALGVWMEVPNARQVPLAAQDCAERHYLFLEGR